MGLLEITNAVNPVTGEFTTDRQLVETYACVHCSAPIPVWKTGCTLHSTSTMGCHRCNGPLCGHCAEFMTKNKGVCPGPITAKIEEAVRSGKGTSPEVMNQWQYKYRT